MFHNLSSTDTSLSYNIRKKNTRLKTVFPVAYPGENRYNGKMDAKKQLKENQNSIRLNKYLSEAGECSRREADRLIEAGHVTVNGRIAVVGERVSDQDQIRIDDRPLRQKTREILLLFYKPRGIVCSTKKQFHETTVTEYLDYPERIYPIGRLDKESEGLLLMTNQGDLLNRILRAGNYHEKEYLVTVDHPLDEPFLNGMRCGVPILDTVTRPCTVKQTGKCRFRIILTQGLNRQIRRMCEYFGYRVLSLKRIRIMNLTLDSLKPGEYREITEEEMRTLRTLLKDSSGGPDFR